MIHRQRQDPHSRSARMKRKASRRGSGCNAGNFWLLHSIVGNLYKALFRPRMAQPHFKRTYDVQSFAKLYQEKERKQKQRDQQKRLCQREKQQKQPQISTSSSTAVATSLEQDVRPPFLTETKWSSYKSGGLATIFASINDQGLNLVKSFEPAELYDGNTLAELEHTTVPFAPISEIDGVTAEITNTASADDLKSSGSWLPCAPIPAQPFAEPNYQKKFSWAASPIKSTYEQHERRPYSRRREER
ncbi:hypothetical protein CGGC5_v011027 [Colletotrichum fructicola Nara gc5]|uniref:Uncharacterized protein n=1 Tax=Colletotrichum fructicola (strain Nara gc5) TaxID=1213859 RepID=A0A7J6ITP1_COLFN|nr:hypothetical protein CGGC5_v011027 [Colletotrichum fructicola Nara gc5]